MALSKNGYALSTRRVLEIVHQMIHSMTIDFIASVGASNGIGGVPFGAAIVNGVKVQGHTNATDWDYPTDAQLNPPSVTLPGGTVEADVDVSDSEDFGRSQLITLQDACDVADDAARRHYAGLSLRVKGLSVPSFRKFHFLSRSRTRTGKFLSIAKENLARAVYSKARKRKGVQCISTRLVDKIAAGTVGLHNGYRAYRARPGRQPLTAAEWTRRYVARRNKKRKLSARSRKPYTSAKRTQPKPPDTLTRRPRKRLRNLKCEADLRTPPEVFIEDDPRRVDVALFFDDAELDAETLTASLAPITAEEFSLA